MSWQIIDPNSLITYWDGAFTTWDETFTYWDVMLTPVDPWSKQ